MKKERDIQVVCYGIRHHGPGSTANLLEALQVQQPDCVLIEGPSDANDLLINLQTEFFETPVALLVYTPGALDRAAFFPFAVFSPEWQAISWASTRDLPFQFIDMPHTAQRSLVEEDAPQLYPMHAIEADPLGYLARSQGYEDVENWWESYFELTSSTAVFEEIRHLIREMRSGLQTYSKSGQMNRLREAYMRECIRNAVKNGACNVAVVCGAWHTSALEDWNVITAAEDKKLLTGIKKEKTQALWIPWSYQRLAKSSGYGAGVFAPMWYEIRHYFKKDAPAQWMAYSAHELRKKGYEMPPSLAIDATILSENLAAIRHLPAVGFKELRDASLSVFAYTDENVIQHIYEALPIGDKVGKVPESAERLPLQLDFESKCRQFRISKDLESTYPIDKKLDLRKAQHRELSAFLHQLILLNIPWGKIQKNSAQGTFREDWILSWDPEYYFHLVEAGTWGLSIEEAATRKAITNMSQKDLPALIDLLEKVIAAGLDEVQKPLMEAIGKQAHESQDIFLLLKSFNSLSKWCIAGHARQLDLPSIQSLRKDMMLYISLRLSAEAGRLHPEKAAEYYKDFLLADQYLHKAPIAAEVMHLWDEECSNMALEIKDINALHGASFRLLIDKNSLKKERQQEMLRAICSHTGAAANVAWWLEGFFQENFLVLLYHDTLWHFLDLWLAQLPEEDFDDVLPLLRRAFSACEDPLKAKLFKKAGGEEAIPQLQNKELPDPLKSALEKILERDASVDEPM